MKWIIIFFILFLALLMFPIFLALFWYRNGKDSVLPIRQDRRRNPRYFAKSFDRLFRAAWAKRKDGCLKLSRPEKYLLVDGLGPESYPSECEKMLVSIKKELAPPAVHFCREICAAGDVRMAAGTQLRAVRAYGNLLLGKATRVERWADADGTVAAYDNCELGISVTSASAVCIGKNCTFRRIFAPVIFLGTYPGAEDSLEFERKKIIYRIESSHAGVWKRRHVGRDDANEEGIVPVSLVTSGNVTIDEDVIIQGNVRTHGGVQLAERSVICGNLYAERDVHLSRNSTVLGSVFTQGDVYCESGVVIGQEGRISSVIARGHITTADNCFVYGYISNESGGTICPVNELDKPLPQREERYLAPLRHETVLKFEGDQDFIHVDDQGYRHNHYIREVIVPNGVKTIPESMFFDCAALEAVSLPSSLEEIGEYAFAGCVALKRLDLREMKQLRRIGRSAFNGCTGLEEVLLPNSIGELGPAAFCDCSSLQSVSMPDGSLPPVVGSHCFQNCPFEPSAVKEGGALSV